MWKNTLKNKSTVKKTMSKEERFQKVALRRVERTLVELDLIANLTTSRYYCTKEQAEAVTSELKKKVNYIEGLFNRRICLNEKKELVGYTHDNK